MINASFSLWPTKYVRNNIQGKYLKDFKDNSYKESDRKFLRGKEITQKSLHEHFLSDDHQSLDEDISICWINNTDPSDPHKKEYY